MDWLRRGKDDVLSLEVYVQPRASREGIVGLHHGAVKLCVKTPPQADLANRAATRFLAQLFSLPVSAVLLRRGSRSRFKSFHLHGLSLEQGQAVLRHHLGETSPPS